MNLRHRPTSIITDKPNLIEQLQKSKTSTAYTSLEILPPCNPSILTITSPKTSKTPSVLTSLSHEQLLKQKRKNYLELMGFRKSVNSPMQPTKLDLEIHTPTISTLDLMGNAKHEFLKNTGFSDLYDECKKLKAVKNINNKKALTLSNIVHLDQIRECSIRSPLMKRSEDLSPLFEKPKYARQGKQARIDQIQSIVDMCDDLYTQNTKLRKTEKFKLNVLTSPRKVKKKSHKFTNAELKSIKRNIKSLDLPY